MQHFEHSPVRFLWALLLLVCLASNALAGFPSVFSDVRVVSIGPCADAGWVDVELEVTANLEGWKVEVEGASGFTSFVYASPSTRVRHRVLAIGGVAQLKLYAAEPPLASKLILIRNTYDLDVQLPLCPGACDITEVAWAGFSACDANGLAEVMLDVHARPSVPLGAGLRVKLGNDATNSIPTALPDCTNACGISALATTVSACGTNGYVEILTEFEVTPPFSNALMSLVQAGHTAGESKVVQNGTMVFTNVVYATGDAIELRVEFAPADGRTLTLREQLSAFACQPIAIPVQLPDCTCLITNMSAVVQPCYNGAVPVEVTVDFLQAPDGGEFEIIARHESLPDNAMIIGVSLTGESERVPVQSSSGTQQATVFLPPVQGSWRLTANLGVNRFFLSPTPTNPNGETFRVQCSRQMYVSVTNDCPEPDCDFSGLRLTRIDPCQNGLVDVTVECDVGPNQNPLASVFFRAELDTPDSTVVTSTSVEPGTSSTARAVFTLAQSGNLTLEMADGLGGCLERIGPFSIPVCSNPCEIVSVVPTGIGHCQPGSGTVELRFELTTRGAEDTWFRLERRVSDWITRSEWIYVDRPVMELSFNVPARGGVLERLELQQYTVQNGRTIANPNCVTTYLNLVAIRDCYAVPDVCLLNQPGILTTRLEPPPPGFQSTYLNLTVDLPATTDFRIEGADELDGVWMDVSTAARRVVDGKPTRKLRLDDQWNFYRIRCTEVPIP